MASRGARVAVQGLIKTYGAMKAVDGVSFTAEPGEFLALLGPSGSGKTTLLMAIAGFEAPDAGTIAIGGQDVTALPPNRRGIGVVFQNYALFPHLTVWENIAFPLRRRGTAKAEIARLVDRAIGLVRLEGHAAKLPAALSGGQQQRVAIARATVFDPALILMDEPLGALDRRLREDMQLEIKALQRRLGVTIIYVTHDQEEALVMADRIAVLRQARIAQIGTAAEIYDRPASAFIADFVGQTNLVPATAAAIANGHATLHLPGGDTVQIPAPPWLDSPRPILLGIRPERLHVASAGLKGTVAQSVYAGPTRIVVVDLPGAPSLRVRIPSDHDDPGPAPGDPITLGWDSRYLQIYPE